MLKTRALTAAILLAVFGSALFFLPEPGWIIFCAVLLAIAVWEWGALAALKPANRSVYTALLVLLFVSPLALHGAGSGNLYAPAWIYYASGIFWIFLVPLWMWRRQALGQAVLLAAGIPMLLPACSALVDLRSGHPMLLLAVLGTVWISDSAAYFVGRRFGKRKLAPSISPGKTWEGVAGALAAVGLYALAWAALGAPESPWLGGARTPWLLAVLLGLAIVGIVGDLFESLIKRQAGVKDSGTLLPGHGGILDRIDAPVAMLPLAVLAFMR
jgi:phosphatidate cytidylyltransferase